MDHIPQEQNVDHSTEPATAINNKKRKRGGRKNHKQNKAKLKSDPGNDRINHDDRVIIRENANFEKYYRSQSFLKAEEFDLFMDTLKLPLPMSFRINTFDINQAWFLRDLVQGPQFNKIVLPSSTTTDEAGNSESGSAKEPTKLSALCAMNWYPKQLAWQMNISRIDLRKTPVLQELHRYIMAETENGFISRQETVSMIPPLVLDVKWGQNILDMCAAPGSKTAQLLEYLKHDLNSEENHIPALKSKSSDLFDDGMVVANDVDNKRCYMLVHQSSRLNSPNCVIINQDASKLPNMWMKDDENKLNQLKFDRILCDVPCSGDGTARKNIDVWKKWNIQNANNFHRMQGKILKRGLELLKPGGKIVYSTCSLNPIENEAVIASVLRESKGTVELDEIRSKLPGLICREGCSKWTVMNRDLNAMSNFSEVPKEFATQIHPELFPPSDEEVEQFKLDKCIRILPHFQNTGAFFLAALVKKSTKLPWENIDADYTVEEDSVVQKDEKNIRQNVKTKRKFKGFKEDPFFFIESTDPDWEAIKDGFGLGDNFPFDQLVHRCVSGKKRSIYLVSKRTRNFIVTNCEEPSKQDFVKIINGGMRLFCRASSETGFRLCQDGVNEVLPYITDKLKVDINNDDLLHLLKNRVVPFDAFSSAQRIRDDIKLGSFITIFKYRNNQGSSVPDFDLPLVAWRGQYTVSLYVTNTFKIHLGSLIGVKLSEADFKSETANNNGSVPEPVDST